MLFVAEVIPPHLDLGNYTIFRQFIKRVLVDDYVKPAMPHNHIIYRRVKFQHLRGMVFDQNLHELGTWTSNETSI